MRKEILTTTCFVLLTVFTLQAQDYSSNNKKSGLAVSVGAAATYYYGQGSRNFGDFENERVNWQLNGMLGLTLARDKNYHRTMLAAFGGYGFNNGSTISHILSDENYITSQISQRNTNNFYQLEGGLLIAEVIRITTGVGQQNFDSQILVNSKGAILPKTTSLKYNSTTVGFNFNLSAVAVTINANFASGKDFEKTIITPSAGLMFRF